MEEGGEKVAKLVRLNAFVEPLLRKRAKVAAAEAEETMSEYVAKAVMMRLLADKEEKADTLSERLEERHRIKR